MSVVTATSPGSSAVTQQLLHPAVAHVAGDDEEAVGGQAGDGEVGEDAAVDVAPLGVDDRARGDVDVAGGQPVEQRQGVRALDAELRHERHVHDADRLADGDVLLARRSRRRRRGPRWSRRRCGAGASGPANHSGYSQPADWPNRAPRAASRSWSAERRMPRPVFHWKVGQAPSPKSTPRLSGTRSPRNAPRRLVAAGRARRRSG